jgi:adenosylcobinamide amidohydrolase
MYIAVERNLMKESITKFKENKLNLELKDIDARVIYHTYNGVDLNTTLVSFGEKRKVLSTLDGFKQVKFVANTYVPMSLANSTMTIKKHQKFIKRLPPTLGIHPKDITFICTAVNMEKMAICEKSYQEFKVCCLATAGAKNNALRMGVDVGSWVEKNTSFQFASGTINIIILTNVVLAGGAMARAIMTATEAKTAALQDRDVRSTVSPQLQATGTGTDSMIVASGVDAGTIIRHTGGHTKMGELIAVSTKIAVGEALKKHDD